MDFDITDGRNRYKPCPNCGSVIGMGMTGNAYETWVTHSHICGFDGPKIKRLPTVQETDMAAFDAWNNVTPNAKLKGASDEA